MYTLSPCHLLSCPIGMHTSPSYLYTQPIHEQTAYSKEQKLLYLESLFVVSFLHELYLIVTTIFCCRRLFVDFFIFDNCLL